METIDYRSQAEDMGQYIEEMHRMMSKACRRLLVLAEREISRDDQIACAQSCIELLQGIDYKKYLEEADWVLESYDSSKDRGKSQSA
jgi:hypothetical protein